MRVDFLSNTVSIISEKEHSLQTGREGAILQQTLCISLLLSGLTPQVTANHEKRLQEMAHSSLLRAIG